MNGEVQSPEVKPAIIKRWLFNVDYLEYYVYCSKCYWEAGDQWTGFSGDDFDKAEKLRAWSEHRKYYLAATHCDNCKIELTPDHPGMHSGCPMQDVCADIPDNPHHYYPGDCKRWEECDFVYTQCRQGKRDADLENGWF